MRSDIEAARAQALEATNRCEELQAELSAVQARFVTTRRRATEVANAAPRPQPPSLAEAKTPQHAPVATSAEAVQMETRSPQPEPEQQSVAEDARAEQEVEESFGAGGETLLDEFVAEAAAYKYAPRHIPVFASDLLDSFSLMSWIGPKRKRHKMRLRCSARSSRV